MLSKGSESNKAGNYNNNTQKYNKKTSGWKSRLQNKTESKLNYSAILVKESYAMKLVRETK